MYKSTKYDIITRYQEEPMEESANFELLTAGLAAVIGVVDATPPQKFEKDIYRFTEKHSLLEHLYLHAAAMLVWDRNKTVDDVIKAWQELSKMVARKTTFTNKALTPMEIGFREHLAKLIISAKKSRSEQKGLESIVTSVAPITPVAGIISKPYYGMIEESDEAVMPSNTVEEKEKMLKDNTAKKALTTMWDMARDHAIIDQLLLHADMLEHIDGPESAISIIKLQNQYHGNLETVVIYYGWAYVYKNLNFMEREELRTLIDCIKTVDVRPFKEMYEAFYNVLPANESGLKQEMEDCDLLDKYTAYPDKFKATTSENPLEMFDLTPLLNYLYTTHRYRGNDYTNKAFMKSTNIGGYIFYREWLIIEPNTVDGHNMPYLYVPVIDDLQKSTVMIIKYWRNGHIDVLTQTEYLAETGANSDPPTPDNPQQ